MTSIISPWAYATQLATQAQDRLTQAATIVRSNVGPRPFEPTPDLQIGIPEQNGPDSPDNPWFIAPKPIAPPVPNSAALRLAGGAVTAIDQALGLGASLSSGVTTAFTRAKEEALSGVRMLEAGPQLPIAPGASAQQFDAASMWLGLAKNLLTLDHGQPMPPVRPPVKPVEPITIQLPSPDSEIQ
jgi:hypothetical protein